MVDVSGALAGASVAATLYEPTQRSRALLVCSPGGTYPRAVLDLPLAGYEMASWLARAGLSVLTIDPLGTGDSTRPADGDEVRLELAAAALATAVGQVRPPGQLVIGVGHSLGAAITVAAQARHRAFDAIAVLGYSPSFSFLDADPACPADAEERWRWALARYVAADPELWSSSYVSFPRGDELPALSAHYTPVPRGLAVEFGNTPDGLADAYAVDVPVYLGFGATDVSTPTVEREHYASSPSITGHVLEGAGHDQFTAARRVELWRDLLRWSTSLITAEAAHAES
jgi:pimeloyl-ACP methyl ester carboxylesterase